MRAFAIRALIGRRSIDGPISAYCMRTADRRLLAGVAERDWRSIGDYLSVHVYILVDIVSLNDVVGS